MYTPFPISDFRTGEFTAREAWLSPADGFSIMKNCSIENGVLKRRKGTKIFGFFPTRIGATVAITASGSGTPVSVELTSHGLSTGDAVIFQDVTTTTEVNNKKYFITKTDANNFTLDNTDQANFTDGGSGGTVDHLKSLSKVSELSAVDQFLHPQVTTTGAHGLSTGDTVYITGDFANSISGMTSIDGVLSTITVTSTTQFILDEIDASSFSAWSSGGDVALVNNSNSNAIMGVGELFQDEVENKLIVANQKRLASYSTTKGNFEAISTTDDFTSALDDQFQMVNAFNYLWMTNNKDNVFRYDGTTLEKPVFDIDGDGGASPTFGSHNDLDRCKFIFQFNRRLMLLYTVEGGTKYPQRVRWSRIDFGVGDTSEWDDVADDTTAGSLDADTDEEIISAAFLKDAIIVFFERSIWALRKTGSFDIPVRWEKLAEAPGVFPSRFGTSWHDQYMWTFGLGGTIATDGISIKRIDEVIPDFESSIRQDDLAKVFASKVVENRQTWIAYNGGSTTQNSNVKILDYENGTFSDYTIGYNVMGEFNSENIAALTWADMVGEENAWKNISLRWKDFASKPGKPRNIVGDNYGIITQINDGVSDSGREVEVELLSARFNPFKDQGKACKLGYVDFLVTENPDSEMTIEFFADWDTSPHTTETVNLENDQNVDSISKIWKRVYVDAIGNSHRIRITATDPYQILEIHAIVPYFAPTGRLLTL